MHGFDQKYMFGGENCKRTLDMFLSKIETYSFLVQTQYLQKPSKFFETFQKHFSEGWDFYKPSKTF